MLSNLEKNILQHQQKIQNEETVLNLLYWDLETSTPQNQIDTLINVIENTSSRHYDLITDKTFISNCQEILTLNCSPEFKKLATDVVENDKKLKLFTKEETLKIEKHCNESGQNWKQARKENNFSLFVPSLLQGIEYKKDFINRMKTIKTCETNYDYLLNDFENNLTVFECDRFFKLIKERIVPLYQKVQQNNQTLPNLVLTNQQQDQLVQKFASIAKFDFKSGVIGRSTHPFSTTISPKTDIRMTYRYEKENGLDCIFTILHESGHSLQGQLGSKDLVKYGLNNHESLIVAESISRTYENYFGRDKNFIEYATPIINKIANLNYDSKTYYKMFNQVLETSKIRVEADELAYPIHVLIRYEIEKAIFNDNFDVNKLEQLWNEKYKKYLNVEINNVNEGILQDGHWSSWSFGYFPTYAMGSALGVSFLKILKQNVNVEDCLKNGDLTKINEFYKNVIFKDGDLLSRNELIKKVTGKEFDPSDYISYLEQKFSK